MTVFGLRQSNRLGSSPKHRRSRSPRFLPDQTGHPQNTVTAGAVDSESILAAGKDAGGQGNDKRPGFGSTTGINRCRVEANLGQAERITTAQRTDPGGNTDCAVFKGDAAGAELRKPGRAVALRRGRPLPGGALHPPADRVRLDQLEAARLSRCCVGLVCARRGRSDRRAEVDVMANIGVSNALATGDQLRLVDWASAKWGV